MSRVASGRGIPPAVAALLRPPLQILPRLDVRINIDRRKLEPAVDALDEPAGGVVPARSEQLVSSRDLDEDCDVPAGRDRHPYHRYADSEQFVEIVVDAKPIVLPARLPSFQLHDELDPLRRPSRGHSEQILDVDHAEPANLHVVTRQLGARTHDERLRPTPELDGVVGHKAAAPHDEIERALTLADAALPHDEHAEPEDVQEHAVDDSACREICIQ